MAAPTGNTAWRITRLAETGSTNADARAGALAGTLTDGDVLVAEHQTAGRGRLDRSWVSAPGKGLTLSALVKPTGVPDVQWGWLPLLAGLAVADAAGTVGVPTRLKWPNDVQAEDGRKLAGVLCARVEAASGPLAVIGIGINVSQAEGDLPVPGATSLAQAGAADLDRDHLLDLVLDGLGARFEHWCASGGDAHAGVLAGDYREKSATLGSEVGVTFADGSLLTGRAVEVQPHGALTVLDARGTVHLIAAGDVTHLRSPGGR